MLRSTEVKPHKNSGSNGNRKDRDCKGIRQTTAKRVLTAIAGATLDLDRLEQRSYCLQYASDVVRVPRVQGGAKSGHRSGCPVSISLEILGDRWSLLIVRDMMVRGFRAFKEFEGSGEGIATNILAGRLRRLEAAKIIQSEADHRDGRKVSYQLTKKGIELAPVLLDLLIWGGRHEEARGTREVIEVMAQNRDAILAEVRRRWEEHDPTPLQVNGEWQLPKLSPSGDASARHLILPQQKQRNTGRFSSL
jgi:DNA-binding HxlR family transcriptional regulator